MPPVRALRSRRRRPARRGGDHVVGGGDHDRVVGGDDERGAARRPGRASSRPGRPRGGVELGGRLVGQQQRRRPDGGRGERDPLLLAARTAGAGSSSLRSASPTVASRSAACAGSTPRSRAAELDLLDGPAGTRRGCRPGPGARRPSSVDAGGGGPRPQPGQLGAVDDDACRSCGRMQPGEHAQQRRLARARRSGDTESAPRLELGVDVDEGAGATGGRAVVDAEPGSARRRRGLGGAQAPARSTSTGSSRSARRWATTAATTTTTTTEAAGEAAITPTAGRSSGSGWQDGHGVDAAVGQPGPDQRRRRARPSSRRATLATSSTSERPPVLPAASGPCAGGTRSRAPGRGAGRRGSTATPPRASTPAASASDRMKPNVHDTVTNDEPVGDLVRRRRTSWTGTPPSASSASARSRSPRIHASVRSPLMSAARRGPPRPRRPSACPASCPGRRRRRRPARS